MNTGAVYALFMLATSVFDAKKGLKRLQDSFKPAMHAPATFQGCINAGLTFKPVVLKLTSWLAVVHLQASQFALITNRCIHAVAFKNVFGRQFLDKKIIRFFSTCTFLSRTASRRYSEFGILAN